MRLGDAPSCRYLEAIGNAHSAIPVGSILFKYQYAKKKCVRVLATPDAKSTKCLIMHEISVDNPIGADLGNVLVRTMQPGERFTITIESFQ